jgi:hypothetical protein
VIISHQGKDQREESYRDFNTGVQEEVKETRSEVDSTNGILFQKKQSEYEICKVDTKFLINVLLRGKVI